MSRSKTHKTRLPIEIFLAYWLDFGGPFRKRSATNLFCDRSNQNNPFLYPTFYITALIWGLYKVSFFHQQYEFIKHGLRENFFINLITVHMNRKLSTKSSERTKLTSKNYVSKNHRITCTELVVDIFFSKVNFSGTPFHVLG